ncbi:MAG: DUF167 domain-containing protein [Candidatus Omnitrophica bacterium]|nr:DUF167 domain-containing protein [Candidatus Omnitrophota bacterium]MBU4590532.1 DUF167 domain-containing protein [Candidatus Omnitrophota bacterium]
MRRIELKVIARAKKEEVLKLSEDSYKIKVSSPPEKGKANKRIIELLSEELGVKKQDVRIVAGETSNKKIVEIRSECS